MGIRALLFDLDGVIRYWDDTHDRRVEVAAGLPRGVIAEIAFAPRLLQPAITGQVTDEQWRAGVAAELESRFPQVSGASVVQDWSTSSGHVDVALLQLVQQYRQLVPVSLLTNATTRLAADLAHLGIADAFDSVFNSAVIGHAKPAPQLFHAVLGSLGLVPDTVAYIDDTLAQIQAAAALGIHAIHYRDRVQMCASLNALLPAARRASSSPRPLRLP
jgi:putative hydrolase of the HAD superfamily